MYASGVSAGPTVGEVRPESRPRKLEVVQIRICAPRDLAQMFVKSLEASTIEDEYGIPFQVL